MRSGSAVRAATRAARLSDWTSWATRSRGTPTSAVSDPEKKPEARMHNVRITR